MKTKISLLILMIFLMASAGRPVMALSLEEAIDAISNHMIQDRPLKPPKNNIAVMKFSPVSGGETELGDYLFRKIRIRMFELDKERKLNFVSQGKVTNLLLKEGIRNLSEVFDESKRVELGKLLTASHFIHGTYEIFRGNTVEIVGYLVDIESGVIFSQKVVTATNTPEYLLASAGTGKASSPKYKMFTGVLTSHPEAARQYKMAEIFERRGRKTKANQIWGEILVKYPKSLEALYIQIGKLTEDTGRLIRANQFDRNLFAAIQAVPTPYQKLPAYKRLKAEEIRWLDTLVLQRTEQKTFDEPLFASLESIRRDDWRTEAYRELITHSVDWMITLGDMELMDRGDLRKAKSYYGKAEQFPMDDDQKKWLADHVRAEAIRFTIRQGNREQAEMALVVWEAEVPESPVVKQLWNELDLPEGMVTIPAGDVKGTSVNSFNLDIYETTNREFLEFVKKYPSYRKSKMDLSRNDENYLQRWDGDLEFGDKYVKIPVVFVSQIVAQAYCKWRGKRLPSSLEWGLAAGHGKRKYPWGNQEPTDNIANFDKGLFGDPLPGDSHPLGATPEGILHMGGNVWEVTTTIIKGNVVSRGGSYFDRADVLTNDYTGIHVTDPPAYSSRFMGFRCGH